MARIEVKNSNLTDFFTFIFFFLLLFWVKTLITLIKCSYFKICTLIYITFGMEILSRYRGEELQGVINTLEDYSFIKLFSSSWTKKQVNNEKFVKTILECCQKYIWIFFKHWYILYMWKIKKGNLPPLCLTHNRMKLSSNRHIHVRLLEAWNSSPAGTIGTNRIPNDIWRISERLQQWSWRITLKADIE